MVPFLQKFERKCVFLFQRLFPSVSLHSRLIRRLLERGRGPRKLAASLAFWPIFSAHGEHLLHRGSCVPVRRLQI